MLYLTLSATAFAPWLLYNHTQCIYDAGRCSEFWGFLQHAVCQYVQHIHGPIAGMYDDSLVHFRCYELSTYILHCLDLLLVLVTCFPVNYYFRLCCEALTLCVYLLTIFPIIFDHFLCSFFTAMEFMFVLMVA